MPYPPMSNNEKRAHLQRILEEVEEDTNLEGLSVVTWDGIRIASAASPKIDADEYSAASAALISLGDITVKRMNEGRLIQVVVRGDSGYTILTRAGTETLIVAVGREQFKFGFFLNLMIRSAYKVAEVIAAPTKEVLGDISLFETDVISQPAPPSIPSSAPPSYIPPESVAARPSQSATSPAQIQAPEPLEQPSTATPTIPTPEPAPTFPPIQPSTPVVPQPTRPTIPSTPSTTPSFGMGMGQSVGTQPKLEKEEERNAILEALKVIGMIGEEPSDD
ncbi:hypothetical protein ES703_115807 [subsurface metagenome]